MMTPSNNKRRIVLLVLIQIIPIQLLFEFYVGLTKGEKLELSSQCKRNSECLSNQCCTTTDFKLEQQSKTCGLNCTEQHQLPKMRRSVGSNSKTRSKSGSGKQNTGGIDGYDTPRYFSLIINSRLIRYYKKPKLTWFQASMYCGYGGGKLADYRNMADHNAINSFVDRSQYPARNKQHGGWLGGYFFYQNTTGAWTSNLQTSNPNDFAYPKNDVENNDGHCAVPCLRKVKNAIQIPIIGIRLCHDDCHIRKSFTCWYPTDWPTWPAGP